MSGRSQEEKAIENNSREGKGSEVKWADTVLDDNEERYETASNECRQLDKAVSWNWRMFAGQGSSVASTEQGHKRTGSYTSALATSAVSQSTKSDSQQKNRNLTTSLRGSHPDNFFPQPPYLTLLGQTRTIIA